MHPPLVISHCITFQRINYDKYSISSETFFFSFKEGNIYNNLLFLSLSQYVPPFINVLHTFSIYIPPMQNLEINTTFSINNSKLGAIFSLPNFPGWMILRGFTLFLLKIFQLSLPSCVFKAFHPLSSNTMWTRDPRRLFWSL